MDELTDTQKNALQNVVQEVQTQLTIQQAMTKVTDKCFEKCVSKNGDGLSSSESTCMANCGARWADALKVMTKRMMQQK